MNVGENIRKLRKNQDLTLAELAKAVKVSEPTLCMIERGTRIPSVLLAAELAKVLGCTVDELLKA